MRTSPHPHEVLPILPVNSVTYLPGCSTRRPALAIDNSINFRFEIPPQPRALDLVPLLG